MAIKANTDIMTIDFEEFDFSDYTSGLENAIENQLKEIKTLKNKLKSASCQITKNQRHFENENQQLHDYCRKLETTNQDQIKENKELKERLKLESQLCDRLEKKVETLNHICLKQATLQVSLDKENAQLQSRCKELENRQAQIPVYILLLFTSFFIYLC